MLKYIKIINQTNLYIKNSFKSKILILVKTFKYILRIYI